jgi:citrate synthase
MRTYEEFLLDRSEKCMRDSDFPKDLYDKHDVKKGLRDNNGKGVVAGLTNVSKVQGTMVVDGKTVPCEGRLLYRGYDINDLVNMNDHSLGLFEKCAYLLLFNELPNEDQLREFRFFLNMHMSLPTGFVRQVILKNNGYDVMNTLSRGVLNLALYEGDLGTGKPRENLEHVMNIIASMPPMAVYGYRAYAHYDLGEALYIRDPDPELTVAENILKMLRPDGNYTKLEAVVLDRIMVLHMEHGGGNNSTFTARVVSSSGSDPYSVIAAALLSLKGPKHGGASHKVSKMITDIKENVEDITDRDQMQAYLSKIADKEAFDHTGLIYGMGHAVYTLSDPRAEILRKYIEELAEDKGREREYRMFELIEELSPDIINSRHAANGICANIDLYSGFVYDLLGIPEDLYTPMFAVARSVGWCAHHLEETISSNKIIRPAYVSIVTERDIDEE